MSREELKLYLSIEWITMLMGQIYFTFLLRIICCICISSTTFAHSPDHHYASVHDFLEQQKNIRILIDDATGYGLQAASTELTNKLRERGFHGQFEVVYSTRVLEKVKTLFDLPDNLPPIYMDNKHDIQFVTMKEFIDRHKKKKNKKVLLGITGGLDNRPSGIAYNNGIDVIHGIDQIDYVNFANFMDTRIFGQMTTFYKYHNYIYVADNPDYTTYPQKNSENKFVTTHVASLNHVKKYLLQHPQGKLLTSKNHGILDFIDVMENHSYNVLPIYGITLKADCRNENLASGCFPGNILQIIAASRYAQLHGPESFHKPLVLAVFYNYEKEANLLLSMIKSSHWGAYENPGSGNVRQVIRELDLADHFYMASSANSDTKKLYSQLKADDILLLWLGPLPKTIFDGIYNHTDTNIWSPIREGNNSFSTIILTGRPHFRCGKNWELGYQDMHDSLLQKKFEALYNDIGFCRGMTSWDKNEKLYKVLGELMIEANNPQSTLSKYFVAMKKMVSDPKNDRLDFLLEEVVRLSNHP